MQQLSPNGKQAVLKSLIPGLDQWQDLVEYGSRRARALCAERGVDWDALSDDDRQKWVDQWLHEA